MTVTSPKPLRGFQRGRARPGAGIHVEIHKKRWPIDAGRLRGALARVLRHLGLEDFGVHVYVVDSRSMRALNRKYFRRRADTDCIAFSQYEGPPIGTRKLLGDVVLSWNRIRCQAGDYGLAPREELLYCMIHGILHLVGHDDRAPVKRKKMFDLQEDIFKRIRPQFCASGPGRG